VRYAAYASRFRTILISAQRYVAYTSDIGESFRPVAHPNWVRAAYGVSWAYLAGDVGYEGFKAYKRNQAILNPMGALASHKHKGEQLEDKNIDSRAEHLQPGKVAPIDDYRTVMAQRAIFQSVASMGLPAFTIHSVVRYSGRALKNAKNTMVRTWAPIGVSFHSNFKMSSN
jgi:fission process protein 1